MEIKKKKMKPYLKSIFYIIIAAILSGHLTAYAGSASLFITKQTVSVAQGDHITVDVKVASTDQSINAVSGMLTFPSDFLKTVSIARDDSILNIWTKDPSIQSSKISFEGVILNPGYQGSKGLIFHVTFEARKPGFATVAFSEGSILANDGLGTNILSTLQSTSFNIISSGALDLVDKTVAASFPNPKKSLALPVITEYSSLVDSKDALYLKGKGEPNALTEIAFEDISHKSFGEQFMDFIQSKKKRLTSILVKNNNAGMFEYVSPKNLVAGVYNATPFLVDTDTNTSKPGLGVQLLIHDSKIIKGLIVFINILLLLIPIVGLIMVIYFIPWYSSRRMRILKRKMGVEEERIKITEHQLEREDIAMSQVPLPPFDTEKRP